MQLVHSLLGPIRWSESYELYGMRGKFATAGFWQPVYYSAKCQICFTHETAAVDDRRHVIIEHFMHCSRVHGYVFDADTKLKVQDRELQSLIQDCQEFDLPFYGYEDHDDCVKQYKNRPDGSTFVVCAVHRGNEPHNWADRLEYY